MGKKYTQFNEDTAPTDDDILLGVDSSTGLTKRHTRANLLTANPIIDPTIKGSANGDLFLGKNNGWTDSALSFAINASNGQSEYVVRVSNSDVTGQIYKGMKIKLTRGVAAPTQCTDLEATTLAQFWRDTTVSGFSFTDDFTCEAWIKPESYNGGYIISKATGTNGFGMYLGINGAIVMFGVSGGTNKDLSTYAAPKLDVWTHVACTLDMSGSVGTVYFNGAAQNTFFSGSGTSLTQAGDLEIGSRQGTSTFDGKICDARVWSTIRTAAQVRDNMNQQLTGSESGLVGYWKFNGNGNDSTSNANNLTANGTGTTPTATNADNPMHDTEYGIVTKTSFSTHTDITVFTGRDYHIPNMSISDLFFSTGRAPSGFPASRGKWRLESLYLFDTIQNTPTSGVWYNVGRQIVVPTGDFMVGYSGHIYVSRGSGGVVTILGTLATVNNSETDDFFTTKMESNLGAAGALSGYTAKEKEVSLTAQTIYYKNIQTDVGSMGNIYYLDTIGGILYAECAYL